MLDQVICSARTTPALFHKHLPVDIRSAVIRQQTRPAGTADQQERPGRAQVISDDQAMASWQDFRKAALDSAETEYFDRLLAVTRGDIGQMVKIADMSKSRIYGLINKHGLTSKK
jgi:two-component system NtrC family response regulator